VKPTTIFTDLAGKACPKAGKLPAAVARNDPVTVRRENFMAIPRHFHWFDFEECRQSSHGTSVCAPLQRALARLPDAWRFTRFSSKTSRLTLTKQGVNSEGLLATGACKFLLFVWEAMNQYSMR
jgi:hypothetical protein